VTHYPHSPMCPSYGVALCGASVSPIPAGPDPFRSARIDCPVCLGARPAGGLACCAEARGRFELMARPYVGAGPA
jgi:hypothetical protein